MRLKRLTCSHWVRPCSDCLRRARDRDGLLMLFETGWAWAQIGRPAARRRSVISRAGGLELAAEQSLDVGRLGTGKLGHGANVIAMPSQPWLELVELRREDGVDQLR